MLRLSCTYQPAYNTAQMTINIYDSQGGIFDPGAQQPTQFCVDSSGPVIYLEGNSRDIYQSIQPTSASFRMLIENEAHRAFLDDLALAEENRFHIEILKGQFASFIGAIIIDEITIDDTYQSKYFLTINASDGFADLQNMDYANLDGTPYEGRAPLTEHLGNVFSKLPTFDILQNSAVYIFSSLFAAEMSDHTICALEQAFVDHAVFQKRSQDKISYLNCYDVLEAILQAFDLRLITNGQNVYIISWNFYANPTKNIDSFIYQVGDMTSADHGQIAIHPIPTCEGDLQAIAGGIKVLQAPARSVSVHYKYGAGANWLFGKRFMNLDYAGVCYMAGTIPTLQEETRFHLTANIRYFLYENRALVHGGARFIIFIRIRLGTHYFIREYDMKAGSVVQQPPEWSTTPDDYVVPAAQWAVEHDEFERHDYTTQENLDILSDVIPLDASGEELEICVSYKLVNRQKQTFSEPHYPSSVNIENPVFTFVKKDNVIVEDTSSIVTIRNTINNTRHFERTVLIGDGPHPSALSRMTVWKEDIHEHIDTTEWTDHHANLGPFIHTEIIARMMIARRMTAVHFKEGAFIHYSHSLEPIEYDGRIYIPVLTNYMTADTRTSGEWVSLTFGEAAALDHTTLVEDDAKLAPGTPSRPNSGDIVTKPIRKTYVGPLTEVTPTVDLGNILSLPEDEQAAIVHMYRNGVKMELSANSGIYDFKIIDNSGPKLRPAIPFTGSDRIETNFFL